MRDVAVLQNQESEALQAEAKRKYIMMRLDKQLFGLGVEIVEDILLPQKITNIPLSSSDVRGALNLRGRIVIAIDLRVKLGMPAKEDDDQKCRHVVVNLNNQLYSFIIDSVSEVIDIASSEIEANPENLTEGWKTLSDGVYSLQDELMIILNVHKLLGEAAIEDDNEL